MRTTRRKVHRSDVNAKEIISAARASGAFVIPIGRPVDLLVGICGLWLPVELKHGKGRYTKDQKEFIALCELDRLPILTWRTVEDVLRAVESIRSYTEVSHGSSQTDRVLVGADVPGGVYGLGDHLAP
jgi:hypothetical protein